MSSAPEETFLTDQTTTWKIRKPIWKHYNKNAKIMYGYINGSLKDDGFGVALHLEDGHASRHKRSVVALHPQRPERGSDI